MTALHDPQVLVAEKTPDGEEYVTIVNNFTMGAEAFTLYIGETKWNFRSFKDALDYCYERGHLKRPYAV